MLCTNFSWNWLSGSGEEDEMWRVYNNDADDNKDDKAFAQVS